MQLHFSHAPRLAATLVFAAVLLPENCLGALTWDTQRIELTSKPSDREAVGLYRFVNTGSSTVTITSAQASCGCTTAAPDKASYAPGEAGVIKAVFTLGDRVGEQEKTIYVVTDDTAAPPVQLTLHVMIPELLTYSPRLLMWSVGEALADKITVISVNSKLRITAMNVSAPVPADVTARIDPVEAGAGYQLVVRPVSTAKVMNVAVVGTATFADGTIQPFKIYALVR